MPLHGGVCEGLLCRVPLDWKPSPGAAGPMTAKKRAKFHYGHHRRERVWLIFSRDTGASP